MPIFLFCRPGFENETAKEITTIANDKGFYQGYCKAKPHTAHVVFYLPSPEQEQQFVEQHEFSTLIFVRQWFWSLEKLKGLQVVDRISGILTAMSQFPKVADCFIETLDTNEGKTLSVLTKKIRSPFMQALKSKNSLDTQSKYRLHLVFESGIDVYLGFVPLVNSAHWPGGIPRLKVPKAAPSRATLKLEEAWHHFVPKHEWENWLAGDQRAVDLGAAPGGWTWQLVNRGMFVDAIDNGAMDNHLMETGQVKHIKADGFRYSPTRSVTWLVCDIVDKPARSAKLIANWLANRWCRFAVFNLKLPMKKRFEAVKSAELIIKQATQEAGINCSLQFKQLYHDREEVTGFARIL